LRRASDFTVYVRGGGIWYVQWLSRQGKRHFKTTRERVQPKLKDRGKSAAMVAAAKIIGSGLRSQAAVLAEYAKDFDRWETSSFIKRQHAKGRRFNQAWANALQSMMEHHVFPTFGKMRMEDLNRPMVEEWLVKLPLSNRHEIRSSTPFEESLLKRRAKG
jgi:hypothetical protein